MKNSWLVTLKMAGAIEQGGAAHLWLREVSG